MFIHITKSTQSLTEILKNSHLEGSHWKVGLEVPSKQRLSLREYDLEESVATLDSN